MHRKSILSFLAAILLLSGCSKQPADAVSASNESQASSALQSESKTAAAEEKKGHEKHLGEPQYDVLYSFIDGLKNEDWEKAAQALKINDQTLISQKEAARLAELEEYGAIVGSDKEYNLIEFAQLTEERCRLTFKIGMEQYEAVSARDAKSGRWYVSLPSAVYISYGLVVPGQSQVYWDEILLDESLKQSSPDEGYSQSADQYSFTCLKDTPVTVRAALDVFGSLEERIERKIASAVYELNRTFSQADMDQALYSVQGLINTMFEDISNGISQDDFYTKFFSINVSQTDADGVYQSVLKSLGTHKYSGIQMQDIRRWDDQFIGISRTDVMAVNFICSLQAEPWQLLQRQEDGSWKKPAGTPVVKQNIHSHISLQKTESGWRIYSLSDPSLFSQIS